MSNMFSFYNSTKVEPLHFRVGGAKQSQIYPKVERRPSDHIIQLGKAFCYDILFEPAVKVTYGGRSWREEIKLLKGQLVDHSTDLDRHLYVLIRTIKLYNHRSVSYFFSITKFWPANS